MLSREQEYELMDKWLSQTHYVGEDTLEIPDDPDDDPEGDD